MPYDWTGTVRVLLYKGGGMEKLWRNQFSEQNRKGVKENYY